MKRPVCLNARMKVLLQAYACNPSKGSEEGVGWGWVQALARHHELHVITAEYHRRDIDRKATECPQATNGITFHYVPPRWWHYGPNRFWRWVDGSPVRPLVNLVYSQWMRDAFRLAKDLHKTERFDLVHLLTYVGFRFPGQYWKLDIPFVWGPIGGLEDMPWRLVPTLGPMGTLHYTVRNLINKAQKRWQPGPRRAFHKANGNVIAATSGIAREIRRWYGVDSHVICEIGPPPHIADTPTVRGPGEPFRIVWSGQHHPGKALPILLSALEGLPANLDWRLDVLGAGPSTPKWRRLATSLGIEPRCHWHGWLPREEALNVMRAGHLLAITSLKDLTSTVLLEAFGQGLPVVCPDHCGFTDAVTDDCGIRLEVDSPQQLARDMAAAIRRLVENESQRLRLAEGALRRILSFSWESKTEKVDEIYRAAVVRYRSGSAATCR